MTKRKEVSTTKRPTAAEYEQRITTVHGLLVKRKTRGYILKHAADNWQLAERRTDELIALATARIKESAQVDRDIELGLALETLKAVISKAVDLHDFQRVIAAQREINQLLSLYAAPAKQTLQLEGLNEDTTRRLAELAAAQGISLPQVLQSLLYQLESMNHG